MAIDNIELGLAANDGTGDKLRVGGSKINTNFAQALLIGDYGLGSDFSKLVTILDADIVSNQGFFKVGSTWAGSPVEGTDGANQGYLINLIYLSTYSLQVFFGLSASITVVKRYKVGGVWSSWTAL